MKKILIIILLTLALALTGMSGCAPKWETVEEATCVKEGLQRRTRDGVTEEKVIPALGHDFNRDNICRRCNYEISPSLHLGYEEVPRTETELWKGHEKAEKLYRVNIGDCTEKNIVVPAYYRFCHVVAVGAEGFFNPPSGMTGEKVETVWLPDNVTEIGKSAFYGCTALKSIVLPQTLKYIDDYAFSRCTALEKINAPRDLLSIGAYAFNGCGALTSLPLGENLQTVGSYAFMNCAALETAHFGSAVQNIGMGAFDGCKALRNVTVGGACTQIETRTFNNCNALVEVVIPASLKGIRSSAFVNCYKLKTFRYAGTWKEWKKVMDNSDIDWIISDFESGDDSYTPDNTYDIICSDGEYRQYGTTFPEDA